MLAQTPFEGLACRAEICDKMLADMSRTLWQNAGWGAAELAGSSSFRTCRRTRT